MRVIDDKGMATEVAVFQSLHFLDIQGTYSTALQYLILNHFAMTLYKIYAHLCSGIFEHFASMRIFFLKAR